MSKLLLATSAFAVSFSAVMIAVWFFEHDQGTVGLYNIFIATISTLTFIVVRAQN